MGKRRRPRPINRHASTEAAALWGPWCCVLDPWLCREAKPERTLDPGATVGVLGTGVPRLACLRPTAWLSHRAVRPIFINKASKTLARGQASRGGRRKTSSGAASPGCLARSGDIKAGQTSRGSRDVSHDDRHQAGASARSVPVSSLVLRRPAGARSTEASSKGFHIGATRTKTNRTARRRSPWSPRRRHHQSLSQAKTTFVRISCTSCPLSNRLLLAPFPLNIWEEDQGLYK